MKPVEGPITADFFERRPLDKAKLLDSPGLSYEEKRKLEEELYIHGAIDIGTPVSTPIRAMEKGKAFGWCSFRSPKTEEQEKRSWPRKDIPEVNGIYMGNWANYFYDVYGGLIILVGRRYIHIIAHSWGKQLFESNIYTGLHYYEEKRDDNFPIHANYTDAKDVNEGEIIGRVGGQGGITGPHVHWEIHPGSSWALRENRINPELWLKL